jgi:hypothetical protein
MSPRRAKRVIDLLGWRNADLVHQLNRLTGTSYKTGDARRWLRGTRDVPQEVAILLRLSVRIAILERQVNQRDE